MQSAGSWLVQRLVLAAAAMLVAALVLSGVRFWALARERNGEEEVELPWLLHALLVPGLILVCLLAFPFSLLWLAYVLKRSGFRARDMLLIVIPVWGMLFVAYPAVWRATSIDPYWSGREDYRSRPGSAWASPRLWFAEIGQA